MLTLKQNKKQSQKTPSLVKAQQNEVLKVKKQFLYNNFKSFNEKVVSFSSNVSLKQKSSLNTSTIFSNGETNKLVSSSILNAVINSNLILKQDAVKYLEQIKSNILIVSPSNAIKALDKTVKVLSVKAPEVYSNVVTLKKQIFDLLLIKKLSHLLIIFTIRANNVFAVFHETSSNKILASFTAGDLKIPVSKRLLPTIINSFLVTLFSKSISQVRALNKLFHIVTIKLVVGKELRRSFFREIVSSLYRRRKNSAVKFKGILNFLVLPTFKPFNGCGGPKGIKKKNKRFYAYK